MTITDKLLQYSLATVLVLLALFTLTAVGRAETQPNERFDNAHCYAAVDAEDQASILVYCTAAAEDHAVDVESEHGELRYQDMFNEAGFLVIVGLAHSEMQDGYPTDNLYSRARELLIQVEEGTSSTKLRNLAQHRLSSFPL